MPQRTDTEVVIAFLQSVIDAARVAYLKADRQGLRIAASVLNSAEHLAHSLIFPYVQDGRLSGAIEDVAVVARKLCDEIRARVSELDHEERHARARALFDPK